VPNKSGPSPKIREGSSNESRKTMEEGIVKEMSFKSGVKGRGSDRWWERRWWLWWGDVCRMRWTRRTVKAVMLTVTRTTHGCCIPHNAT